MKANRFFVTLLFILPVLLVGFLTSCEDEETLANVETSAMQDVTATTALAGGDILDPGSHQVYSQGVCYSSVNTYPRITDNCLEDETLSDSFQLLVEDLEPNTDYYLRAFAQNEVGVSYGAVVEFTTLRDIPKVKTLEPENIENNSAMVGGEILDPGASAIIQRGICYSQENSDPDFDDTCLNYDGDDQIFQLLMEDLDPVNQYHVRAFAENNIGYHFGESYSFTTNHETVTDIDGNVYRILEIGNQTWMIDNLRTTRFSNGDPIPLREDNYYWTEETAPFEPAYCWYHNDESYADPYGALYNFAVASDERNVCPDGWRVMTGDDLRELIMDYLGSGHYGGMLKTTGTIEDGTGLWHEPNTEATNLSGFSAIPGGIRNEGTGWMGLRAVFWTSRGSQHQADVMHLFYSEEFVRTNIISSHYGFSIRCLKE